MDVLGGTRAWLDLLRGDPGQDDLLLVVLPQPAVLRALATAQRPALVLSPLPSAREAAVVLAAGADGYLSTASAADDLRQAAAAVRRGHLALDVHGAAGLATVLGLTGGPVAVTAACALAARGVPWSLATAACGVQPAQVAQALEEARAHG